MGTHWVSLFVKTKYTVYFDSFGVEHIRKEINKFIRSKELGSLSLIMIRQSRVLLHV